MVERTRETFLLHAETTDRIIGTMYNVQRELGFGFAELVYRRAMAVALRQAGASVLEEAPIFVQFRGQLIGEFRADLVVDGCVLVEIKAGLELQPYGEVQLLNYLKAAGGGVGLLIHFGRSVTFKRRVFGNAAERSLPNLAAGPPIEYVPVPASKNADPANLTGSAPEQHR
jgi:GxxExxY protein